MQGVASCEESMTSPPVVNPQGEGVSVAPIRFSSHDDIAWLRDSAGIFIFDACRRKYWLLAGLDADLWDWFALGHPLDRMVERLASMTNQGEDAAKQAILRFIRHLVQEEIWVEVS